TYPQYWGVAILAGMAVLETGKTIADEVRTLTEAWDRYDHFFMHIRKTDANGEYGNLEGKAAVSQEFDALLPDSLRPQPDVIARAGHHCTPYLMKSHSFHPVPLLLARKVCDTDETRIFTERECMRGSIGTIRSDRLLGLMLANAG